MATPKGNYLAFQPLQPEKYTQGDLYMGVVGQLIADKKAAEAAKLKQDQEQRKALIDINKNNKVDFHKTIANLQDGYNEFTIAAMNQNAKAGMLAADFSADIKDVMQAQKIANTMAAQQKAMGTFMTSEADIKNYNNLLSQIGNGDYYQGDPRFSIVQNILNGTFKIGANENGEAVAVMVDNPFISTDKPNNTTRKLADISVLLNTPLSKDKSVELEKRLMDAASSYTSGYSDGNNSVKTISFDREKAERYLKSTLGYDADKSLDDVDLRGLPPEWNHLYFKSRKKEIENPEELKDAINIGLDIMSQKINESKVQDKKLSALEEQKIRAQIRKIDNDIANDNKPDAVTSPVAETANVRVYDKNGKYIGYQTTSMAMNNIPGTKQFVGVKKVANANGKGTHMEYFVGSQADDGTIVWDRSSSPKAISGLSKTKDAVGFISRLNSVADQIGVEPTNRKTKIVPSAPGNKSELYGNTKIVTTAKDDVYDWEKAQQNIIFRNVVE